ncbi:unnamed protein product [Anisakis simplex]|uniref:Transthyretin-like family protein n=1 Tax=Anisakis simplex TaxID=6269 RepID=A0A0M3JJ85_ANISI|nr:unnamed protein product [Anisakis simplex]
MALQFVGLIITLMVIDGTFGKVERFHVVGRVVCGTRPIAQQPVTLYGLSDARDDYMKVVNTTDEDGKFLVFDLKDQLYTHHITITHDCKGLSYLREVGLVLYMFLLNPPIA